MSEKVCKILLRPSPPAWGTPSRRGICGVDVSLSFYLIFIPENTEVVLHTSLLFSPLQQSPKD